MIYLQIYLISCIPALLFFLATVWEDIQCYRGIKKPCSKFGYNWKFPLDQHMTPFMCASMLIPGLNLFTGWWIVGGIIVMSIGEWIEKQFAK